jgi:hypothetical protein
MYTAPVGKDRTTMRITAGARNLVIIPTLEEALQDEAGVSQPDTLLSPKSYIVIRNDSSYSFRLAQNSGIITPENISGMAAGSPVVNSGDRAAYNIVPSGIISYKISCNTRDIAFPYTPEIAVGRIMFYSFDGNVISCTDTKTITQANIGDIPDVVMQVLSRGLYKGNTAAGAERIGYQNLSGALQYIGENAVSGDNYYIVLGEDESDGGYGYTLRRRYNYENQQYERLNITLLSDGPERTITVSSSYDGFIIEHGATLTLERNVTIRGTIKNRSYRLIAVSGTLVMNGGTICGNIGSHEGGGGVYVGGVFTMNGGTISGNTALSQVNNIVGGNTRGGGVYIGYGGIFTKQWGGGWVYGSNAAIPVFKNTTNGHVDAVGYYQGKERNTTITANELFDSRMDIRWD